MDDRFHREKQLSPGAKRATILLVGLHPYSENRKTHEYDDNVSVNL